MFMGAVRRSLVGGAVCLPVAATLALGGAANAEVPPSEKIYSRVQTWTCEGLGVFEALYSPWGNNPHVKWLSRDGGREDAVQITLVSARITLVLGGVTYEFEGPTNPPAREGQAASTCTVHAVAGADSISGTAVVAVVPRAQ